MNSFLSLKRSLGFALFIVVTFVFVAGTALGQDRERVVEKKTEKKKKVNETRPTVQLPRSTGTQSPRLTNRILVVKNKSNKPLVRKTGSSRALNDNLGSKTSSMSATTRAMMMASIRSKLGIRYRYGTQGPRTYDCSGFVWKVFQESGVPFTRTSARVFWKSFEPVFGKDRFEFGTLVFLNRLGHVGIVADEKGFYHASTSKGVTYSPFKGYWSKRIVGFRRVPLDRLGSL